MLVIPRLTLPEGVYAERVMALSGTFKCNISPLKTKFWKGYRRLKCAVYHEYVFFIYLCTKKQDNLHPSIRRALLRNNSKATGAYTFFLKS